MRIEGTVTEKWTLWLERCDTSKMGEEVDQFQFGLERERLFRS